MPVSTIDWSVRVETGGRLFPLTHHASHLALTLVTANSSQHLPHKHNLRAGGVYHLGNTRFITIVTQINKGEMSGNVLGSYLRVIFGGLG